MDLAKPTTKLYCNVLAIQKGIDPAGSASAFQKVIVFEAPLPWKNNLYQKAGVLPQEAIDLMGLWLKRYHEGRGYPNRLLFTAPDAAYSRKGYRRVMFYTRPPEKFAQFTKVEYLVPEVELGAILWALYESPDTLPHFEKYREARHDSTRDILVCTHGSVDVACAKFGYPLYNDLRKNHAHDDLRVWRVSHFGGHIYAPTIMDMPLGHYWAYVEETQAAQIVQQKAEVRTLYGHYRGWAGLDDSFLQAAERELWIEHGWEWFSYLKVGRVIAKDANEDELTWADIQIDYTTPDHAETGTYIARVEVRKHITTPHSTDSTDAYPLPQYAVKQIQKAAVQP
jgi:hypothetical protein